MKIKNIPLLPAVLTTFVSGAFLSFFLFFLRAGRGTYTFNRICSKIFNYLIKKDLPLLTEIVEHLISYHYIYKVTIYSGNKKITRVKPAYTRKVRIYKRSFHYGRKKIGSIRITYS